MAMMKIYCKHCNQYWEVYQRDNWKSDNARTCPHCFKEIDPQTWTRQILPAFGEFQDMCGELVKSQDDCNPKFSIDFIDDFYFPEKKPQIYDEE